QADSACRESNSRAVDSGANGDPFLHVRAPPHPMHDGQVNCTVLMTLATAAPLGSSNDNRKSTLKVPPQRKGGHGSAWPGSDKPTVCCVAGSAVGVAGSGVGVGVVGSTVSVAGS